MSEPTRKFVKPSVPGARIPDPAHPRMVLPQAGAEVVWDHYWRLREHRGEIVVVEPAPATPAGA